jgi:hypothetical protein
LINTAITSKEILLMKRWLVLVIPLVAAGLMTACGSADQRTASQAAIDQDAPASGSLAAEEARADDRGSVQAVSAAPSFATQSNNEKAVAVDVTPLNLATGNDAWDFEVAFNTHSVDLSFDPAAISVLRDNVGHEYPAIAWEGSGPGGHHRSGVLRFNAPEQATGFVELVIHDVAGVPERVFHWDLTQ